MSLADVQAAFQAAILGPDSAPDNLLRRLAAAPSDSRAVRFGIYHEAYRLRLVEVLGKSFERLRVVMGEAFEDMARAFVDSHPSPHRNIRWYGQELPAFLRMAPPWCADARLAEFATLEGHLNDAFDAPDASCLTLGDLAAYDPAVWPDLVFAPHPAARHLEARHDIAALWEAAGATDATAETCAPVGHERHAEPLHMLTWRQEGQTVLRAIPAEEAAMWADMSAGLPFGQQCTLLATIDPADAEARAAGYLAGWIQSGLLASAALQ